LFELGRIPAQQEEAIEVAVMRIQEHGVEGLDSALALAVLEELAEMLGRSYARGRGPNDSMRRRRHWS
jgi:hypothetical protein